MRSGKAALCKRPKRTQKLPLKLLLSARKGAEGLPNYLDVLYAGRQNRVVVVNFLSKCVHKQPRVGRLSVESTYWYAPAFFFTIRSPLCTQFPLHTPHQTQRDHGLDDAACPRRPMRQPGRGTLLVFGRYGRRFCFCLCFCRRQRRSRCFFVGHPPLPLPAPHVSRARRQGGCRFCGQRGQGR